MDPCDHTRLTQMRSDEVRCLDCGWTADAHTVRGAMRDSLLEISAALEELTSVTVSLHADLEALYHAAGRPYGDDPDGLRQWLEEGGAF